MRPTTYRGRYLAGVLAVTIAISLAWAAAAQSAGPPAVDETVPPASDSYPLTRDSNPQPGIPKGNTFEFEMTNSTVFPGTTRTITVYVPAQYAGGKPACLYVGFDGLGFNAATVFDNLIAQHAMPVTIGIGVSPGTVLSARAPENPRFDRSFEFDSRSDRLARFVLEEVIPAVQKHGIPGGRALLISSDGNDHAIGGGSTGAIAAFTVAWERPDAFRRVFSAIGTYVGMRGGETYSILVRKTEPKPLRIFMQDGMHDEWMGGPEMGDWWMSNRTMERSLEFAGYDVRHIWGVGTHNGAQASAVFPDAMRWLWKDWPQPIRTRVSNNPVLQAVLRPGEDWQIESESNGCPTVMRLTSDRQGKVTSECGPERSGRCDRASGGTFRSRFHGSQ